MLHTYTRFLFAAPCKTLIWLRFAPTGFDRFHRARYLNRSGTTDNQYKENYDDLHTEFGCSDHYLIFCVTLSIYIMTDPFASPKASGIHRLKSPKIAHQPARWVSVAVNLLKLLREDSEPIRQFLALYD